MPPLHATTATSSSLISLAHSRVEDRSVMIEDEGSTLRGTWSFQWLRGEDGGEHNL